MMLPQLRQWDSPEFLGSGSGILICRSHKNQALNPQSIKFLSNYAKGKGRIRLRYQLPYVGDFARNFWLSRQISPETPLSRASLVEQEFWRNPLRRADGLNNN